MINLLESETGRLLQSLEKVVSEWAMLSVDLLGEPPQVTTLLPLERHVLFSGGPGQTGGALLVLRGSFGLGLELARSVRGLPGSSLSAAEAAFSELTVLLADEWRRRLWEDSGRQLLPGPAEPGKPASWPEAAPKGQFAAVLRGFAIEARIWT